MHLIKMFIAAVVGTLAFGVVPVYAQPAYEPVTITPRGYRGLVS